MTEKQVNRYLYLVSRKLELFMAGTEWRPEYDEEMREIEQELAELTPLVEQERARFRARKQRHQREEWMKQLKGSDESK